jgi:hypothetical protein
MIGRRLLRPSRRELLQSASCGFGYLALRGLCAEAAATASRRDVDPLAPKPPHFAPRARRVIFLFMFGGPSQMDTFDYKPKLQEDHGKAYTRRGGDRPLKQKEPEKAAAKQQAERILFGSPWKFRRHGESGLWVSELFPHLAGQIDELCILRGMHTDTAAHPTAVLEMHTGTFSFVRPSVGAWVLYGLGTENRDLPGFLTITPAARFGGAQNYGSAFLPAAYQGTRIGDEAEPLAGVKIPHLTAGGVPRAVQRARIDLLQELNRRRLEQDRENEAVEGVIRSYELADRMQAALPRVMDLSSESRATLDLYGIGVPETDNFGRQCLLARRLAESGVRFIEINHGHTLGATVISENWDQHRDLVGGHTKHARATDRPIAGLIADLKQRGLLDDTLLVWGGEFGRTPTSQGKDGRDHNPYGFTMWMAGGGVKGGRAYGATDDYGDVAVEGRVHVHDLHATILHLLGLDHTRLTYHYSGRDFRLTDVAGRVVEEIFA